jgi:hypothetical protein
MRATFLCLAALLVGAAPAPAPGREAKQKLETFRKQLMRILDDWAQDSKNILDAGHRRGGREALRWRLDGAVTMNRHTGATRWFWALAQTRADKCPYRAGGG